MNAIECFTNKAVTGVDHRLRFVCPRVIYEHFGGFKLSEQARGREFYRQHEQGIGRLVHCKRAVDIPIGLIAR
jgi:hypothetical protein